MTSDFDPYRKWLGIPAEEQPANHYRLLGIRLLEDDPEVISNAADRQMAHLRNYQSGEHSALSQKLLNEVAAARVCLLNPKKKAAYDQQLHERLPSGDEAAPFPDRDADVVEHRVELCLAGHRADLGLQIERIAHTQRSSLLGQRCNEAVMNALRHDDPA